MVPFHIFNLKVMSINPRYELVMFKRFLLKLADGLCSLYGYKGIVTGDSLSASFHHFEWGYRRVYSAREQ